MARAVYRWLADMKLLNTLERSDVEIFITSMVDVVEYAEHLADEGK